MKKKKIIISIIILIITITFGVSIYIFTDTLKSPKQLFKKYLFNNFNQLSEFNLKPYDEVLKNIQNGPTETKVNFSDTEESLNITTSIKSDTQNQSIDINAKNDKNTLLEITLGLTNNILGIKIPDINEKYIAIENRDLKKLAKNLGISQEIIDGIPNSIPKNKPLSKEEIKKLKKLNYKYIKKFFSKIDNSRFIIEKNQSITTNTENLVADKYSFSINTQELKNINIELLNELYNEKDFMAIINDRIENSELENYKKQINDKINAIKIDTEIKLSVYVNGKKTVKTEIMISDINISIEIRNSDSESTIYCYTTYDEFTNNFIINNKFSNNKGELTFESNLQDDNQKNKEKIILKSTQNGSNVNTKVVTDSEDNNSNLEISFISSPDIKIDQVSSNNAYIINDFNKDDFQDFAIELMQNVLKTAEEKPESLIAILFNTFAMNDEQEDYDFSINNNNLDLNNSTTNLMNSYTDEIKEEILQEITEAVNKCFTEYKRELDIDEEANLDNFLTVENIQDYCLSNYKLELISGTTLKCTVEDTAEYYIILDIDFDNLNLNNIKVYTSEEYENI